MKRCAGRKYCSSNRCIPPGTCSSISVTYHCSFHLNFSITWEGHKIALGQQLENLNKHQGVCQHTQELRKIKLLLVLAWKTIPLGRYLI